MANKVINIPFCGFYCSWYDSELDSIIEREVDYRCDTSNEYCVHIPENEYSDILYRFADFREAHIEIARKYVDRFNDFLCEELNIDQGFSLEFEKLESPREYNFSTDRIFAFIPEEKVNELFDNVNQGDLAAAIKDHFTPRSGFIPFYSDDVLTWLAKPVLEWDYNELSMLLHGLLKQVDDDWQFRIYERMLEDCQTAFDNCVDWAKVDEAVQTWKEENEVIA